LWGLGVALSVCPLALFVLSRPVIDLAYAAEAERRKLFATLDVPDSVSLSSYLRQLRESKMMSLSEVSRVAFQAPAHFGVSPGFLSQLETNHRNVSTIVSGDKLWALGVVYGVDPLGLFVMSRGIDAKYREHAKRLSLFLRRSV